jgi:hypothetical protein
VLGHAAFNSRLYEYGERAEDHFVLHLAGVPSKTEALAEARRRFGLDAHLLPPDVGAELQAVLGSSMFFEDGRRPDPPAARRPRRLLRRAARAVHARIS